MSSSGLQRSIGDSDLEHATRYVKEEPAGDYGYVYTFRPTMPWVRKCYNAEFEWGLKWLVRYFKMQRKKTKTDA